MLLRNRAGWVFPDLEHKDSVMLLTLGCVPDDGVVHIANLKGPAGNIAEFTQLLGVPPAAVSADELRSWSETSALPALHSDRSLRAFRKMRSHPGISHQDHGWSFHPATELHATQDKKYMVLDRDPDDQLWPVYSGRSFNLWDSDTGKYYAAAKPDTIVTRLFDKRRRQARTKRSPFFGLAENALDDPDTLPCFRPRIAFRTISPSANPRTLIVALIPPRVVCNHMAPYLLRRAGDEAAEAFVLGALSTVIVDWFVRRFVETSVDFHLFQDLPVPILNTDAPIHLRVIQRAGTLAATDDRFADWADGVNVPVGSVLDDEEKYARVVELDAAVGHLYGLDSDDIKHVFETFHDGWDPSRRLERVLDHYEDLKSLA
jgi:hypothetical protein